MKAGKSRFIGKTYDAFWVVIKRIKTNSSSRHYDYILENCRSKMRVKVSETTMTKIDAGLTTVAKTIRLNILKNKPQNTIKNGINYKKVRSKL